MRRTKDNAVVEMGVAAAQRGMRTFAPGASQPMYVPIGPIQGFTFTDDGGVRSVAFDPDQAVTVAQNQGKPAYPSRLAIGVGDPAFKAASVYKEDRVRSFEGRGRSGFRVLGERVLNVGSMGLYGALLDEDEREADVRARANLSRPFISTAGTFGGIAVGLLFPYGAAAKILGKGAMATGKASGLAQSAAVGKSISNTNLIGLTANAAKVTRAAIGKRTDSLFLKNYGGGLVSAAVAEAPLSLAIAAADITDYNKDFSAQALAADAGVLWLTGMAFAGGIGFSGSVGRSVLAKGRQRGASGAAKKGAAKELGGFVVDVGGQAARRYSYIGNTPIVGALKANIFAKVFRKVKNMEWFKKGVHSSAAKKLTGELIEDFQAVSLSFREAGEALRVASVKGQASELRSAAKALAEKAPDRETARRLLNIADNADDAVTAVRSWHITAQNVKEYADEWNRWAYHGIEGVEYQLAEIGGAQQVVGEIFEEALSVGNKTFASKIGAISGNLQKTGTNGLKTVEQLFAAKKAIIDSGDIAAQKWAGWVDDSIDLVVGGDAKVMQQTIDLEMFGKNFGDLQTLMRETGNTGNFSGGALAAGRMADRLKGMSAGAQGMGFRESVTKQIAKDAEVHVREPVLRGFEVLSDANGARKAILFNEGDGFASVSKMPTGPRGEMTFGNELLETQVRTVSEFKSSTGRALSYLLFAGSPRGAVLFGGVLAYRNLTQERKRENFESISELVLSVASTPETMIEAIGKTAGHLAQHDMEAATAYSITLATAQGYLLQQMPRSSDPLIGPQDYSMHEVDSYLETVGALESPASVIASAKDGSVSIEAVDALRTVYPELYSDMVLDIAEFMQTRDWDKLNEAQRLGLDTFTGGALGVLQTYGPMPQPLFAQTPMQQQALGKNTQQSSPQMAHQQSQMNSTGGQKVSGL